MRRMPLLLGVLVALAFVAFNTFFIVDERQKAMVLQFGQVRAVKEEPGLGVKIPSSRTSSSTTAASRASTPPRWKSRRSTTGA